MSLVTLQELIETKRAELSTVACGTESLLDYDVLKVSQELDELIVQYQRIQRTERQKRGNG